MKKIGIDGMNLDEASALQVLKEFASVEADYLEGLGRRPRSVEEILERDRKATPMEKEGHWREWIRLLQLGARNGHLQEPELFFLKACAAERVNDIRRSAGAHDQAFDDVELKMKAVLCAHGLADDEYWPPGDGPEEWEALSREYDRVSSYLLAETMNDVGLIDEAALYRSDPAGFHHRRELGRRAMNGEIEPVERLDALQEQFYKEAQESASVGAFHAAASMIGAAIETALLIPCLCRRQEALDAYQRLPKRERPRSDKPSQWTLVQLARIADAAGWLPVFDSQDGAIPGGDLVQLVRGLRNMLHPARHFAKGMTNRVVRAKYNVAQSAYVLLRRHLASLSHLGQSERGE